MPPRASRARQRFGWPAGGLRDKGGDERLTRHLRRPRVPPIEPVFPLARRDSVRQAVNGRKRRSCSPS